MGKYDDRPYKVGKGKPPKAHQFKKGQSGNPRGPKRNKTVATATIEELVAEALNEPVTVIIRGRERTITKKEAIVLGITNDALTGTPAQRMTVAREFLGIGALRSNMPDERPAWQPAAETVAEVVRELVEEYEQDREKDYLSAGSGQPPAGG